MQVLLLLPFLDELLHKLMGEHKRLASKNGLWRREAMPDGRDFCAGGPSRAAPRCLHRFFVDVYVSSTADQGS